VLLRERRIPPPPPTLTKIENKGKVSRPKNQCFGFVSGFGGKLNLGPHESGELVPDPVQQNEKQDPDPYESGQVEP
jgi:hypothetical protein